MAIWLFLGALNALVAVAAGAYGRHGVLDAGGREMFAIGSQYQMTHALALLAVAWLATLVPAVRRWWVVLAGVAFTAGIVLFCGSLYAFGMSGLVPVEGAAPAGGMLMMAGWLALMAIAVDYGLRRRRGTV